MSTPRVLVVIVGVVVLGQLAFAQTVTGQQQRFISGVIENLDGEHLSNTSVRLTNLGSVATSETGEFSLLRPPRLQPGDPIEISVGEEWVVVKPFEGQGFIPPSFTEVIHVRVARRGDPRLLTDPKLVKQLVVSVISVLGADPGRSADRDQLLAEKVREMGFSVDQLKSAIDAWRKGVQRPYEKGLAALYTQAYADASTYIREAAQVSDDDQVEKYLCLASAEYLLARYSEAVVALQAARLIQPNNPRVLNRLGVALMAQGHSTGEPIGDKTSPLHSEPRLGG
jgi:tetratricopeptide (TPR) repeat protein